MLSGIIFGLSSLFSARTNLKNGREQRALQSEFHAQDRADAWERFQQSREDARERSEEDSRLREAQLKQADRHFQWQKGHAEKQFKWSIEQAERALVLRRDERMQDFLRQDKRDAENRSFDSLRNFLNLTPATWVSDPNACEQSGLKSLRILFLPPRGAFQNDIETYISESIKRYENLGGGHSLLFPTKAWKGAAEPGAWVAQELYAWNRETPTLIVRLNELADKTFVINADMFGFPMGDRTYKENIILGKISNDTAAIGQVLSLISLAASDMHFLSTYGTMPMLPKMLSRLLPQEGESQKIMKEIVASYRATVNTLLEEVPEAGLHVSLQLAEALAGFSDQHDVFDQLKQVEQLAGNELAQQPDLIKKVQDLYKLIGMEEEAAQLGTKIMQRKTFPVVSPRLLLEDMT